MEICQSIWQSSKMIYYICIAALTSRVNRSLYETKSLLICLVGFFYWFWLANKRVNYFSSYGKLKEVTLPCVTYIVFSTIVG